MVARTEVAGERPGNGIGDRMYSYVTLYDVVNS